MSTACCLLLFTQQQVLHFFSDPIDLNHSCHTSGTRIHTFIQRFDNTNMIQNTGKLSARTVLITGASRGFGRAIAEKVAADGANVVVLAKTTTPQPLLEGTIYDTEKAVLAAGGKCLAIGLDVRHEDAVRDAIDRTIATFGGIDIVINNASAMHPYRLQDLDVKKFNLMTDVILRGTFLVTKYSLPHLKNSPNPHVLNICPPLNIVDSWFKYLGHLAVMKYAVSLSTLSLSQELAQDGIAVNALWPKTAFWSAFMSRAGGYTDSLRQYSRKPDIMSDAAYSMITKDSKAYTGNFMYDDDVLLQQGVTDFETYAEVPGNPLMVDIFVKDEDCKTFTPLSTSDEALKNVQRMLAMAKSKL